MADTPAPEKTERTPANENPWYCMMTLHGEQPEGATEENFDISLHNDNRDKWNKWVLQIISELEKNTKDEIKSLQNFDTNSNITQEEMNEIEKLFKERKGNNNIEIPSYNEWIQFNNIRFDRSIILKNYIFIKFINISNCYFTKYIDISKSYLYEGIDINESEFDDNIKFNDSIHKQISSIKNTYFNKNINFKNCKFNNEFEFTRINTFGDFYLDKSIFNNNVNMTYCNFYRNFSSKQVQFDDNIKIDFSNTKFFNKIEFQNSKIKAYLLLYKTQCFHHPPNFNDTELLEGTKFTSIDWPDINKNNTNKQEIEEDILSYQRLKQISESLKRHEDELEFFAREMACKRALHKINGEYAKALLLDMYAKFSDYGRSVAQPSIALALTMGISTFIIWIWMSWDTPNAQSLPKFKNALGLSLANLLAPLNFRKDFYDEKYISNLPELIKLISGVQTLSGLLFTFLIGLALRNRFRMK